MKCFNSIKFMATGPQTQNTNARLRQAEAIIDKHIKSSERSEQITIDVGLLPVSFNHRDWETLKPKYLSAGWKTAEWVSDQRDGDYLDFQTE